MTKEEIEKLKEELREELRQEITTAVESTKKTSVWQNYIKSEVQPYLDEKIADLRIKYQIRTAIGIFARTLSKKRIVAHISEEDLENIKPSLKQILDLL